MTTIRVSEEYWQLAKQKQIKFTDALRMGLSIMLNTTTLSKAYNDLKLENKLLEEKILKLQKLLTQALEGGNDE